MAEEPRLARLHLVPATDRAHEGVPVVDFDDVGGGHEDAVVETADLQLVRPAPGLRGPARLAVVEQPGAASAGAVGPPVRVAELGATSSRPDAGDEGSAGTSAPPPARVARLGPILDGSSRSAPGRGSAGEFSPPPVRIARLGSSPGGRGDDRRSPRAGRGPAPEIGGSTPTPDLPERSPRPRRSDPPRARTGAEAFCGGPGGDAPGRPAGNEAGQGQPSRVPSGGDQGRRRTGPKQIDPGADPVAAAKDICLDLLTTRARTKHELADALRRRGVPDEAAAAALERFGEVGLIDDAAFAGQWVRSRQRTRGLARRALAVELRRKGVDDEVAGEALAEVDADAEEQRARELVDRKLRTVPAGTPEQRVSAARRLVGMLARKGYSGGIAYRVVREALAAHGVDVDELTED